MPEAPKRMHVKITNKGIVGSFLGISVIIHPFFIPQGQMASHAYFCRHCKAFWRFYVRSYCKWNQPAKALLWRLSWGLQQMSGTTKYVFINDTFEIGKEWIGLSENRWWNLHIWQKTELLFWKGHTKIKSDVRVLVPALVPIISSKALGQVLKNLSASVCLSLKWRWYHLQCFSHRGQTLSWGNLSFWEDRKLKPRCIPDSVPLPLVIINIQ